MKTFKKILSFIFNFKKETPVPEPDPVSGQIWYMPCDIADRYCTPIIISVIKVVDNTVHYVSNYSQTNEELSIEDFKKSYTAEYKIEVL